MSTARRYWACQCVGWGIYSVLGVTMMAAQIGWKPHLIIGYALFFFYSIALTDLLRREMKRRGWLHLPAGSMSVRLAAATLAAATIQSLLVLLFDIGLDGSLNALQRPEALISIWISVA